jgi:hypothetical protein
MRGGVGASGIGGATHMAIKFGRQPGRTEVDIAMTIECIERIVIIVALLWLVWEAR